MATSEVSIEFLQAFADAWNRHDVDALMTFMTEDCVFEASAGEDVCGTVTLAARQFEPDLRRSGRFFRMHDGAIRAISCAGTGVCLNGHSRALVPTVHAWKCMAATCLFSATERLP
jgi:hypothetical protein